jgi:predicted ATPase/class 3 adenylate cyclase
MFCDLASSTALAAKLDPEDMRDVNRAYQDAAKTAIERFDGFVARYMGDGVLAYFGYPQAHEDDAERAVRAGMHIVDSIAGVNAGVGHAKGVELAVRVGIATGRVVVGDLIGEGASQESAVVGETPNLAAKLQGFAKPNTVVVAPSTRRLTAGNLEYRDLGVREVKGLPAPVQVSQVVGEGFAASRFEAARGQYLLPLIGREDETATLLRRWELAKEGEGQVVLVSGEPGIGKSRLTQELGYRIAAESYTHFGYQCSPYHSQSALFPIITQLERAAGLTVGLEPHEKLDKLKTLLSQSTEGLENHLPSLAALLSIPTGDDFPKVELDAKRRREQTLVCLIDQLEGSCRKRPVLCVFEDVHWIDPSTRELLDRIVDRVESLRALLIITFRPEFVPSWTGQAHVTLMAMSRMTRRVSGKLVAQLAGAMAMPPDVLDEVIAKSDGVPLFVEELTRTVMESERLARETERGAENADRKPHVPETLQDSLMSRLDQLSSGKPLAQLASVIGREFDYPTLSAACDLPPERLENGLDELEDAGIVHRRGSDSTAVFSFKHALVRDAAYESLVRETKRDLHERVARAIEQCRPEVMEIDPELLAHHFTEAGLVEPAVRCWHHAGQRASERFAMTETIAHITRALSLVDELGDPTERAASELRLQITLGPALMNTKGSASSEVATAYRRARELSDLVGEPEQKFIATWGLWLHYQTSGQFEAARRTADEVVVLGGQLSDSIHLLQGHHAAWTTAGYVGNNSVCLEHVERGLALYDIEQHRKSAYDYGDHDPGLCAQMHVVYHKWFTGNPDQAVAAAQSLVKLGEALSHPLSLAQAQSGAAMVHQFRREPAEVLRYAQDLLATSSKFGLEVWRSNGEVLLGWANGMTGEEAAGIETMRRALEERVKRGLKLRQTYYLAIFAELLGHTGDFEAGLDAVAQALAMLEQSGERRWESIVNRVHGDLLRARGDEDMSEDCFKAAIECARRQDAKSLELRAAIGLAGLWRDQGKTSEAKKLLAPIHGFFQEGLDTTDLRDASALLETLS